MEGADFFALLRWAECFAHGLPARRSARATLWNSANANSNQYAVLFQENKIAPVDTSVIIIYDNSMNGKRTLSEKLKRRRQALGLSLSEVARRAGTSAATLSRYESNWTRFEVCTLRKLASALDCELELSFHPKKRRSVPRVAPDELATRLGRLFWDSKLTVEAFTRHPVWVVERVLEYGKLEDLDLLREAMGREAFLKAVAAAGRLSPQTRSLWKQILDMEGVKCTKKYSRNTAWIS